MVLHEKYVLATNRKSYPGNLLVKSDLTLNMSFKVKQLFGMFLNSIKRHIFQEIMVLCEKVVLATNRKSYPRNSLITSDLTLNMSSLNMSYKTFKHTKSTNSHIFN